MLIMSKALSKRLLIADISGINQNRKITFLQCGNKMNMKKTYQFSTHLLYIDLNVLLQIVSVQVQHKVVHVVEAVTHNDEGQLVGELSLLQEVLHSLGVVAVALPADPLYFFDLSGLTG